MFKKYEFTSKQWRGLQNYAKEIDINFFTTPGSLNDLSHFNLNDFPFIKIGSDDFVNKLLLTEIIKMKLPILISRGMSSKKEVNEMVSFFKKKLRVNCLKERVSIMHCVSLYPSPHESINIDLLNFYKRKYNQMHWGYSDHSLGDLAILVAASNNINIFEKHFTLDINQKGPDHKFSIDPKNLRNLISKIKKIKMIIGNHKSKLSLDEVNQKELMRRKAVSKKIIKKFNN